MGGVLWATVEKFGSKIIQFFTTIILARILLPEDFGTVAMVSIFFAISMILIDSGFSQALIREDEISERDKATTFYINFITAIFLFIVLWVFAPLISEFFQEPVLLWMTRFMAFTPIFFSLTIVQRALYSHRINFRTQAFIYLISSALSGVSAVILALYDLGVWALASQYVLLSFVTSFLFWGINPWLPKGFIDKESFKKLFGFGSNLMLTGLISVTFREVYKVIIGRLYSTSLLGFYAQAENIKNVVSDNLVSVLVRVTYPALSKVKDDIERLKDGYRKILKVTSLFIFPAMIGLILVAEPMIVTVIGEKWLESVPIVKLLAILGMIHHMHVINLNILKVLGRSDLILKLEIIKKIGVTIAIIIGLSFGFWGLVVAQVVSSYVSLFINMIYTATLMDYSKKEQIMDVFPILFFSIPMGMIVFGLDFMNYGNELLRLLVLVLSGIFVYLGTCFILKPQPFKDIVYILRPKFPIFNKIKL
ncbi:MAG: lipopolysaccharide biosynthesis protein [Gracilimonas sp.]|uniref:lipopolysaccharide biosynthesis protein n=1 Tax=Gracilimonas sp. TaxID=1974203 RepID=UPI0019BD021A|nr:lipopolysaccharide biosynthesis protein [Gracilimonas sp.]MBD3616873.1 lipopolysaccharide biosynthesis protein [Gracilimonas sp.]